MEGSNMAEIIYALRPNRSYVLLKLKPWIRKVRTSRGHLLAKKELSNVHGAHDIYSLGILRNLN